MRTKVVPRVRAEHLRNAIDEMVDKSRSRLMTDDLKAYRKIGRTFAHGHAWVQHNIGEYARGDAHVNTCESFFALLKRGIHGSFHHVSRQHLQRYCDEFSFRWNHRKTTDAQRTELALRLVLCHSWILGYTNFSLHGASSIFICQSTPRCPALTSVDQAAVSSRSVLISPIRRPATH